MLYNNCSSAIGVAVTGDDDNSTARLTSPEIQITSVAQLREIKENNNQITRRTDDNQTY